MKQNKCNVGSEITSHPLAAHGFVSYRCKGNYGWIMIGATDHEDAMLQARQSSAAAKKDSLEIWNGTEYVPVVWGEAQLKSFECTVYDEREGKINLVVKAKDEDGAYEELGIAAAERGCNNVTELVVGVFE